MSEVLPKITKLIRVNGKLATDLQLLELYQKFLNDESVQQTGNMFLKLSYVMEDLAITMENICALLVTCGQVETKISKREAQLQG